MADEKGERLAVNSCERRRPRDKRAIDAFWRPRAEVSRSGRTRPDILHEN